MSWTRLSSVLAFAMLYVAAVGGFEAIFQGENIWEALCAPFERAFPYDAAAVILALGFAAPLWIPNDSARPLQKAAIWRGLAFGCAITTAALYATVLSGVGAAAPALVGALVVTAVAESFVGLVAVFMLLADRECRKSALVPAGLNIVLGVFGVVLVGGWV